MASAADLQQALTWPSSRLLGSEFVSWDAETGTAEMRFVAPPEFRNMRGTVQGGLVAGFLDEVLGCALWFATGGKVQLTLDLNLSLLRPVPIGKLVGKARAVRVGSRVAFLESELFSEDGTLVARATATSIPTDMKLGGEG